MSDSDPNKNFTFTRKWVYVPGRQFDLKPLNIEEIKKQLLEESESEGEDNQPNEKELKPSQPSVDLQSKAPQEEKSNFSHTSSSLVTVPECSESNCSQTQLNVSKNICLNKENVPLLEEHTFSKPKSKNDSFDLDFSALSLHTPAKRVMSNFNFTTPKINVIPPSESKSVMKTAFKTPNISLRQQPVSKPLFRTPLANHMFPSSSLSLRKQNTPSIKGHNLVFDGQQPKRMSCIESDGLNHISVNEVEYVLIKLLGKGGSSEVFHAFHSEEKLSVAIKSVDLTNDSASEGYINEVKLLHSLQNCDKIIKMFDYEVRDDKLLIVLEKCGDDLRTTLKRFATEQSHLPNYTLLYYWMEMLHAVNQIHQNGVIHSDLKPANFLRSEEGLKLIDFGIASKVQGDMTCVYKSFQEGSFNYISPEAIRQQNTGNVDSPSYGKPKYKIHFKSDVWSLGCILYQLVYKKTPFQHITNALGKLAAITNENYSISYPPAHWVPSRIVDTIKRCLQHDVRSRPSVSELICEYEEIWHRI